MMVVYKDDSYKIRVCLVDLGVDVSEDVVAMLYEMVAGRVE